MPSAAIFHREIVVLANSRSEALGAQVQNAGPRGILILTNDAQMRPGLQSDGSYWAPYRKSSDVGENNGTVVVLTGAASLVLRSRRFFRRFKTICVGTAFGWICAVPGLLRHTLSGDLEFAGLLPSGSWLAMPLLVFNNRRPGQGTGPVLFAPAEMNAVEQLRMLEGVDYVALRSPHTTGRIARLSHPVIIVRDCDLDFTKTLLSQRPGSSPIDVFSECGAGGHGFKLAPYFPPKVARRFLSSATAVSGIKVIDRELAYLAHAYHLLFHQTDLVPASCEKLADIRFPAATAIEELSELALAANRRIPATFTHLEEDIISAEMMPPLDMIGFYSHRNPFLRARYLSAPVRKGLAVILIREFGLLDPVTEVRKQVLKMGFQIVMEGHFGHVPRAAIDAIRGGNWYDRYAFGGSAPPNYYFICENKTPIRPSLRTRKHYPLLDDETVVMLKRSVREDFAKRRGTVTNIVHASDNALQAWEYVCALGHAENLQAWNPLGR